MQQHQVPEKKRGETYEKDSLEAMSKSNDVNGDYGDQVHKEHTRSS